MILYKGNHFGLFAVVRDERNCSLSHQSILDFRFFYLVDKKRHGLLVWAFSFSATNKATIWLSNSSFSLTIRSPSAISFWILPGFAASSSSCMLCRFLGSMRL